MYHVPYSAWMNEAQAETVLCTIDKHKLSWLENTTPN